MDPVAPGHPQHMTQTPLAPGDRHRPDACRRTHGGRPVALVTGASRGLGFLIAQELAGRGHDLVICARSESGLGPARDELSQLGVEVAAVAADVGIEAEARRLVAEAETRFGRLDVLVLNAGVIQVGPASEMSTEDFASAMDVMFWGAVHLSLAALPLLSRGSGRVLAVTSVGGKLPAPHLLPYCAAKHAAVGFAEGLRVEAVRHGVSVTVGVPGLMRTGSTRNALFTGQREAEHRWFTAAASLPVLSMDAGRAARRLVRATMSRRPELILTPLARLGVRAHAMAPATSLRLVGVVNRLLPAGAESVRPVPGHALGPAPAWFVRLTRRDRRAARQRHQLDDPVTVENRALGESPGGRSPGLR
jgi:NAD(P)-dependent dehydrogenase (short-subunit alcohol dehydrogenase family)